MAIIKKDGVSVKIEEGYKKCKIVSCEFNDKKIVKGKVFEQGYITFEIENGTSIKQYMLIAPWTTYLFYKLIKAIKGSDFNVYDEYEKFNMNELIGAEVVIELKIEIKNGGEYMNVTNVYNIEDGEIIIEHDRKLKEERYSEMEKNNMMRMEYINNKVDLL
ncbi:hypothetical protein ACV30Q_11145 [Clostridium perfringens]|uniref:hypothetical protein n=1 Tax=Bacillota TaxID=1239 RepID=UPI00103E96EA|nr:MULTISPECIES: hypothetical protein [Bacillota]EJT6493603.1 hypothetical protein [Clostridium perfringens]MDB8562416.1 hypothetical protein [Turicibacter sanguinis]MDH5069608.1 hypothetical protein [Clostridium perfringens]MDH5089260.1 hypothetical protein [Clostridium perfringens]MDK0724786.1 hypothetical protein [Clostridium perfringens]